LPDRKAFLALFVIAGFFMKIAAELFHELCGHGLFVLLFGGEITGLYISVLWPYELSHTNWFLPSDVASSQMVWIYAGGILVCVFLSFLTQAFLLFKERVAWDFALALFWLAFWTFVSSAGYLIVGGLTPFGDVDSLIRLGILTAPVYLAMGLIVFGMGFVALSSILRKILIEVSPSERASRGVSLFWLTIPTLVMVMLASPEYSMQIAYVPIAFVPALLSFVIEYFVILSQQKTDKNPDNVAEE